MEITATRKDDANIEIVGNSDPLSPIIEAEAKKLAKGVKIAGFRKGKVPVSKVKEMYGEKLEDDARTKAISDMMQEGIRQLDLDTSTLVGDPSLARFEIKDDKIYTTILLGVKPSIDLSDIQSHVVDVKLDKVKTAEVLARLDDIAKANAPIVEVKDRELQSDDIASIDFVGSIDGTPFENGSAENFDLAIGSHQFVGNFEEQLIGMKVGDERDIKVSFPKDYAAKDLASKSVDFHVKLNKISKKEKKELDDEMVAKIMQDENATLSTLKNRVKEDLENEAKSKVFNEKREALLDALVAGLTFDIPTNVLNAEKDIILRIKYNDMDEKTREEIASSRENYEKKRDEYTKEAEKAVRVTFIVNEIAAANKLAASNDDISRAIYYEALMNGKNPQEVMDYYQSNNLLPSVRMAILEEKVINHLLEEKLASKADKKPAKADKTKEEK